MTINDDEIQVIDDSEIIVQENLIDDSEVEVINDSEISLVEEPDLAKRDQKIRDDARTRVRESNTKTDEETIGAKDIGAAIMHGASKTYENVGYLLEKAGLDTYGKAVRDTGKEAVDYWESAKSDVAKIAEQNNFTKKTEQGHTDWPATITNIITNPGKISMSVGESLTSTGLGMATGGLIGKGFTLIPKIGEGVAYAMGYGLGEGMISASQGAQETEETILKMSHAKLMEHPEYRAVFKKTKDTKKSKQLIADAAAGDTAAFNMLTTTILSSPMGYVFSPIFKGKGNIADDFTKSLLIGFSGEGAQEATQSAAEKAGQNIALKQNADEKIKVLYGVIEAAVAGAVTGAAMGGGIATGAEIHTAYTESNQAKVRQKAMRDYARSFTFTGLTPEQQNLKAQLLEMEFTSLTPKQQAVKASLENMVFDSLSPEQRVEAQAEEARVAGVQKSFTELVAKYGDVQFPDEVIADIDLQERILKEYETIEDTAEEALAHKEPNYAENIQIEKAEAKKEEETLEEVGDFFETETKKVNKRSEAAKARQEKKREQLEKEHGPDEDKINEGMKVPQKKKTLPTEEDKYKNMSEEDLNEQETIKTETPQEETRDNTVPESEENVAVKKEVKLSKEYQKKIDSFKLEHTEDIEFYQIKDQEEFIYFRKRGEKDIIGGFNTEYLDTPLAKRIIRKKLKETKKTYTPKHTKTQYQDTYDNLPIETKTVQGTQKGLDLEGAQNQLFDTESREDFVVPKWANNIVSDTIRYQDVITAATEAKNGNHSELSDRVTEAYFNSFEEETTKEPENNQAPLKGINQTDPNTLHANPLGKIFNYFFVQTTGRINKAKNVLDKIVSENITGKIKDTKFDDFVRKYLGASQSGLGQLTRKQELSFVDHFRKLQTDLAKSDITAEEKAEQLKKQQNDLTEQIFNEVSIQYLENPEARGVIEEVYPELATELNRIREYINTLSLEAMERGIILPSQYNKWKDRYLSRLYLSTQTPQIAAKVSSGIKLYEQKSGRKIDSIVDYLMENPNEADRLGVVLDIDKMIKTTIAKTQGNIGLEDFLRGITEKSEIVSSRHMITVPYRVANLPTKFSPMYAKNTFIPYVKDMIQALDKTTHLSSDMQAIAQTEAEILRLEKILEHVENSSELAQSEIDTIDDDTKATIPSDKRYGVLAGLPLSKDVASLVISQFNVVNNPEMFVDKVDHAGKKLLVYFKWAKVPANIFAYPRNFQSNFFQWAMSGADPAQFFKEYTEAAFSMYKKKGKYYQIARGHGVLNTNAISAEVNDALKVMAGELRQDSKVKKEIYAKMQTVGNAYGVVDDIAKIARIKYAIEQEGKSVEEAVNIAQNTHYDYSLTYDLIRGMRDPDLSRGMGLKLIGTLFPTYTHKTIAYLYDTFLERPVTLGLIGASLFYMISGDDDETRERIGATDYDRTMKTVHDWAKDNPMLRIDMKRLNDGTIDVTYTDVSYVVPFGSLYNAGFNVARGVRDLDIGKAAEGVGGLGIGGSPIQMIGNLVSNKDSYTKREIYFEHDPKEKAKDIAKYFGKQFAPGTFTKLISLKETKHPIMPRLAGINTYVYNSEGLADMSEYRAKDAIIDAGKRSGRYKRKIRQAQDDFRNNKITEEERDNIVDKNTEEVKRWKEIGERAFNKLSSRSEEYKIYNSKAKEIKRTYREFNALKRNVKKDKRYAEEYFTFNQDQEKMKQVKQKKFINKVARDIKKIKHKREGALSSAMSETKKKQILESLNERENYIYTKAYKVLTK